jgi:hypothetical protein
VRISKDGGEPLQWPWMRASLVSMVVGPSGRYGGGARIRHGGRPWQQVVSMAMLMVATIFLFLIHF